MNPVFKATQKSGVLTFDNLERYCQHARTLPEEVEVIVRKRTKNRSTQQNRYLFGCVYTLIAEHTGHSVDEIHEYLAAKFLKEWREVGTDRIEVVRSSTRLTTIEFEDYASKCRQWASTELGVFVPLPNEVDY